MDDTSFLQRLTPRRARSNWSQKNVQHAERLIAQGRMQSAGLVHVEAARSDGRWAAAYAGSATMEMPEDFLAALQQNPVAHAFYAILKRQQLFTTYYPPTSAKPAQPREHRPAQLPAKLANGRTT